MSYTATEIKQATAEAMHFLYGTSHILLNHRFRYDRRTRIGKLAASIVSRTPVDRTAILELRRKRCKNKPAEFCNYLRNPLVKDFRQNRSSVKEITAEGIMFWSGRNHWIKNTSDINILKVLAKYHYQTKAV